MAETERDRRSEPAAPVAAISLGAGAGPTGNLGLFQDWQHFPQKDECRQSQRHSASGHKRPLAKEATHVCLNWQRTQIAGKSARSACHPEYTSRSTNKEQRPRHAMFASSRGR